MDLGQFRSLSSHSISTYTGTKKQVVLKCLKNKTKIKQLTPFRRRDNMAVSISYGNNLYQDKILKH